ncbi:transcriptional regulator [Burkholderia sp. Bp8963]|nr:transcriptional regulator [Burkholderia sp. Bp8963]
MRKIRGSTFKNEQKLQQACSLNALMLRLGRRWKLQVLYFIHRDHDTFGKLKLALSGISDQILALRLRELINEGLVTKDCNNPNIAGNGIYQTTQKAEKLLVLMENLCEWERFHGPAVSS